MKTKKIENRIPKMVKQIVAKRLDLSDQLVHLTREYKGIPAKQNLISILRHEKIEARNTDFLFKRDLPLEKHDDFKVISFTETPLEQITNLTNIDFKRKINLESFGVIIPKSTLLLNGASPVNYLYQEEQRVFYGHLFEMFLEGEFDKKALTVFPFIKGIHEHEDFHWEREWKKVGDLSISPLDYSVVVPSMYEAEEIYKEVYLSSKQSVAFYATTLNDWVYISYFNNEPQYDDGEFVHLESGYDMFSIDFEQQQTKYHKRQVLLRSKVTSSTFY